MNTPALPENGVVVTEIEVLESWLDYKDHMNVAYYVAAFDLGIDAFKATLGIDLNYIAREKRSTVALEAHITYKREASKGSRRNNFAFLGVEAPVRQGARSANSQPI